DICEGHDCKNGGNCVANQSVIRGYTCSCVTGYVGDNCEVGVCESHSCINGGLCEADQTTSRGYKCNCVYGYVGDNCEVLGIDCKVYRDIGYTESGVYGIYPFGPSSESVRTYCDMETADGGWTAIQKRLDGSLSFDRQWLEYKRGFGAPEHSYWIGNDIIHQLTKGNDSSLFVSITLINGTKLYELFDRFSVSTEENNYQLFIGGPAIGTLGDRILNPDAPSLSGLYFTTTDRDNDRFPNFNCAKGFKGGWWYNRCHSVFLNGPWSSEDWDRPWYPTVESGIAVRGTLMMIKRQLQ
ncbi:fibroleukin-like, partial [Saccostrea cucullata]|uniref:fibroleukin-like n=1 Tax=Saccostrea cuccullata TaxID=36930 RepID=UPI002ED518C1